MMSRSVHGWSAVVLLLTACGAPPSAGDGGRWDGQGMTDTVFDAGDELSGFVDEAGVSDAGGFGDVSFYEDATDADGHVATDGSARCIQGMLTEAIARCIDGGDGPRACLARARAMTGGAVLCDQDRDGLADDLEDALGRSYALAFAFNGGDGTRTGGNPEPLWPDNVAHYVSNSRLIWRVDNDRSTVRVILDNPTLETLASASIDIGGRVRYAWDPSITDASNFWLCLQQVGGRYTVESQVRSMEASRTLPGGIDVAVIVHPSSRDPGGRYVFVANVLYYAYNEHSEVDNHEGDWEGAGVLVDLETGQVLAAYFDRHDSADNVRLLQLTGPDAVRAVDPASERTFGNLCTEADFAAARGVRFWDYRGVRHHVVVYVSTGGHAGYGYPGNTKILGVGCWEYSIVRDTHNGDGYKFLPWQGVYVRDWTGSDPRPVVHGVHLINVGEDRAARVPWVAYRGQWGCQHEAIAKSYPGPWGNARHCRPWITHDWGAAPPFVTVSSSSGCSGAP